jgi:predicted DNA-binding transcriptional regulator AlpA
MTAATFDAGAAFPDDRLLPWPKVRDLTGISRTTAWRLQKAGDFPLPVVISPGRVGWRESEVQAWKASRSPRAALPKQEKSFLPFAERELRPEPAARPLPLTAPPPPPAAPPRPRVAPRNGRKRPASDGGQITFDFG